MLIINLRDFFSALQLLIFDQGFLLIADERT